MSKNINHLNNRVPREGECRSAAGCKGRQGFTLVELLIVVAIIAVLVAIAVPIFSKQLEKSRESTDFSNVRTAYAEVMHAALADDDTARFNNTIIKRADGTFKAEVIPLKQKTDGWSTEIKNVEIGGVPSNEWVGEPVKKGACTVSYDPSTEKTTIQWGTFGSGGGGFPDLTTEMMENAVTQGIKPGNNTGDPRHGKRDINYVAYYEKSHEPCLCGDRLQGDETIGDAKPNTVYKTTSGEYWQTDGKYWYKWDDSSSKWSVWQWYPDD